MIQEKKHNITDVDGNKVQSTFSQQVYSYLNFGVGK